MAQHIAELEWRLTHGQRHDDEAGAQGGKERDDGFRTVIAQLIRDPVPWDQPEVAESGRHTTDLRIQFRIGELPITARYCQPVRETLGRLREDLVEMHGATC